MSASAAASRRVFQNGERPPETLTHRKSVAIGDLHGDFYRLTRLLEEEDILIPSTFAWNPRACNVDLILIGDYVDWRGEPLEGSADRASDGARRILELLHSLDRQVRELREQYADFDGRIYVLRGNHDDMMLDALKVLDFMSTSQLESMMRNHHHYLMKFRGAMVSMGLGGEQLETMMKFLNWFVQGGRTTLEGWESLEAWKRDMDGELGTWLRHDLLLGAVVNNRLYAHTAPDLAEFWRPLHELRELPAIDQSRMRESFLWSRKLWGFDYYTGSRSEPFSEAELDRMLSGIGVEGVVVGHTPVTTETEPFLAYNGKVINIDLHGIPGSRALVETYEIDPASVRGVDGSDGPPRIVLDTVTLAPRPEPPPKPMRKRASRKVGQSASSAEATASETAPTNAETPQNEEKTPSETTAPDAPDKEVTATATTAADA